MYDRWIGSIVTDMEARPYRLAGLIASGGQGAVFSDETGQYAIKVIFVEDECKRNELRRRYLWLFGKRLPREARLVTPAAVLSEPYVGYVMRRVKGHEPLSTLVRPSISTRELVTWFVRKTGGLRRRLLLGAMLANCFRTVHLEGLAHCDVSDRNILVAKNPQIVSVCLIDCDNLSTTDAAEWLVLGTPGYTAPEIIKGCWQPDSLTDSYSLAVILFRLLRLNHPFVGDAVNEAPPEVEEAALLGEMPYIDHPTDDRNRASTGLPPDVVFTPELERLFARAFTDGVHHRHSRPTPTDWHKSLVSAADLTKTCRSEECQATFYPKPDSGSSDTCTCPFCGHEQPMPMKLRVVDCRVGADPITGKRCHPEIRTVGTLIIDSLEQEIPGRLAYSEGSDSVPSSAGIIRNQESSPVFVNMSDRPAMVFSSKTKRWQTVKVSQEASVPPGSCIVFGEPSDQVTERYLQLLAGGGNSRDEAI